MISCIQNPNACQLYVVPNLVRDGVIESFLTDLQISAERAMAGPKELSGRAAVYGMAQVTFTFLHAVECLALAPVSNSQAQQNSSLLTGCCRHASFLLVDAILTAVEHSCRF